jgi:hypothetical protein
VTETELVSDDLSPEDARVLRDKVREAGVPELHEASPAAPAHADELSYELTVEQEGRTHTVRLTESTMPEPVRSLLAWLDSVPERRTRIRPPG